MEVQLSKAARKQLAKVPQHIVRKFALWRDLVRFEGLAAARAIPGFRITPSTLTGGGTGPYRLSDAYRAIYIVHSAGSVETVYVEEGNKHDY